VLRYFHKLKTDQQVNFWSWIGKVAPLTALVGLILALTFDVDTWVDWIVCGIALSFAIVAFTWWWWVIYAVKDLFNLLTNTNKQFEKILTDIKEVKDDIKQLDPKKNSKK